MFQNRVLLSLWAGLVVGIAPTCADDVKFRPGDVIEYKVGVATPEKWERGVIIKSLDGGRQYLIHEKPSQFFPDGPERAYAPAELRRPAEGPRKGPAGANPAPALPAKPAVKGAGFPAPEGDGAKEARELLSEEDVLAYARRVFGGADKEANQGNPMRTMFSNQIRDYIKQRGTSFKASATGAFYNTLNEQGTSSVHIVQAINDNYGAHPKLQDYFGTFWLRSSNRGSKSVTSDGAGGKTVIVRDSQHESGRLTINRDGTYEWEVLRGDPSEKWLHGEWRVAKPEEMMPTEGGPAIWLENAKGGNDYMVRMDRHGDYANWINVGVGKGRTPVEYGRRPD